MGDAHGAQVDRHDINVETLSYYMEWQKMTLNETGPHDQDDQVADAKGWSWGRRRVLGAETPMTGEGRETRNYCT